jgi:hypothetical protein
MFMVGGIVSTIWCFIALGLSIFRIAPTTSLFPEIDFASKITHGVSTPREPLPSPLPFHELLSKVSNASSSEIRDVLAPAEIYVRVAPSVHVEGYRPIGTISDDGTSIPGNKTNIDGVLVSSGRVQSPFEWFNQSRYGRF